MVVMGWFSARRIALSAIAVALMTTGCSLTVRVSTSTGPGDVNGDSTQPSVSGNGRFVAFSSLASNLVPVDMNDRNDVFVRDTFTGKTTRVSVDSKGAEANASSDTPFISANGRYVTFTSSASNLAPNDDNGVDDVFLHDMQTGTTTLLTKKANGHSAGGGFLAQPEGISNDGSIVLFLSNSPDIGGGSTAVQAYFVDTATGAITRVSDPSTCPYPNTTIGSAVMTPDASKVAYGIQCWGSGGIGVEPDSARVIVRDFVAHTTSTAFTKDTTDNGVDSYEVFPRSITAAGDTFTFILSDQFGVHGLDNTGYVHHNGTNQVFDPHAGVLELGSLVVSPNGRYLLYSIPFSDPYAPENTNIVLLDTQTNKRYSVAVTAADQQSPAGVSQDEVWSADGSTIAFDSNAQNINVGGPREAGYWNVYTRSLHAVLTLSPN
jgi:Tol biopolymer transport system component